MIKKKIVWLPYDFDTAIGINNEGSLVFGYELEDTDHIEGGADVFNGQGSVVWNNVRDAFGDELAAMYKTLRSTGALSYSKVEEMFESHQSKWPEAIFNEDSWFKYIDPLVENGSGAYLPMMQGSKAEQRKWWLYNRFRYIDSKYNAGDALSDLIQIRGYAKSNVTVTPYADIYPTVKYGSYLVQTRGERNVASTLACPLDNVNDTEIYIYSASQLASIGDLSGFKIGFADFSMGTKLQSIKIGDSASGYDNANLKSLTLGNNVLLKVLDVRNCSGMGTGDQKTVDLSGCEIIEEVYFDGTSVAGVTLPNGGFLKVLHLPAAITNLTILNQKSITDLTVTSYSNISTLRLENVPTVDTKTILQSIPETTRVRLIGFYWEAQDAQEIDEILDTLDTMRGLDENGNNMATAQVSGTIHVPYLTGAEYAELSARYPYITIAADHTASYLTYKTWDGATTIKTVTCSDGVPQEAAPAGPARTSTAQYSYTFVGWNTAEDAQTADASCITDVAEDRTVYAAYSRTVREYTVTWKNADGTTLKTETKPYGSTASWSGAMPTYNGQTAQGWTPTPGTVTGNITYTASYIPTYTVYFYNGSTLLEQHTVQQGGSAVYTGATPVDTVNGWDFDGWNPQPTNVQSNLSCYAQFKAPWENAEIADDWATIITKINNGTATYKPGNYKALDLGAQGTVNMQIVALNKDPLASGSGNAATTWISKELLLTKHRMNPARSGSSGAYDEGTGAIGGWEKSEMRTYMKETIKPLIPSNVRSAIKEVTKVSRIYDTAGNAVDNVTSTDDVWIPSRKEMNISTTYEANGFAYAGAFPDNASRIKSQIGASSASWWWLRSANNASYFNYVNSGGSNSTSSADDEGGVAVGFCL